MIALSEASIFFDGITSEPRLSHPECVAFDASGAAWCGGDRGELYRVAADGSAIEQVASSGGFTLGVALDGAGGLYTCDLAHSAVYRLDCASGALTRVSDGDGERRMRVPNFAVVDTRRGCLYVSDSYDAAAAGPGVWRIDLETGATDLWYAEPLVFANGMALTPDGDALYVIETWARRVIRLPIGPDGRPGTPEPVVEGIERVPDGLAVDVRGRLYIACYEPSRIYRFTPGGELEVLLDDPDAHVLCHPTNCAFRGTELFAANLGRWHLTRVDVGVEGAPLSGWASSSIPR